MKRIYQLYKKVLILPLACLLTFYTGRSQTQTTVISGSGYTIENLGQPSLNDSLERSYEYRIIEPQKQNRYIRVLVEFQGMTLVEFVAENQKSKAPDLDVRRQQFMAEQNMIFQDFERDIALLFSNYQAKCTQSNSAATIQEPVHGKQFYKAFFGQQLTIDSLMIQYIEELSYVKKVHRETRVKANLNISVPQIHADSIWINMGCQADSIRVGIIDTGIDYTHPDLGGGFGEGYKVVGGYDFVNMDNNPMDDNEHGTHVAGIVAADGTLKGVAPKAWLYAIKVLDGSGSGWESDIIRGIEFTVDPNGDDNFDDKLDVVNMSLGGEKLEEVNPMETAVENAIALGVTYCIAAGNEGTMGIETIGTPGATFSAITVGGTNTDDRAISWYSSIGPTPITFILKPDIVAPGFYINSTVPGGGYAEFGGTSMATPHVTGTAALLKKLHPDWTPADIKSAIMSTARDLGEIKVQQGAGFLDAYEAAGVKTLISNTSLNFGINDLENEEIWTAEQTISIKNCFDQAQSYNLSGGDVPNGVSFSFSESSLSLSPDESRDITVTIQVDNSVSLKFPSAEYPNLLMFTGTVLATTTADTLQCLWNFNRGSVVSLSSDRPFEVFLAWTPEGYFKSEFLCVEQPGKILLPKDFTGFVSLSDTIWMNYDKYFSPVNFANRHILKNIHMQPGDTVLTFSSDEAKNKIILATVDEVGQHITPVSTTFNGLALAVTDSININILRFIDNNETQMVLSGLSELYYGVGTRIVYIENRFWTDNPDDQMTMLDTIYLSDMPDNILIAGGETRWNLGAEPNTLCFNSFDAVEGLNHDILVQNEAEDYNKITYVSGGFSSLDWTPLMYWQRNSYLRDYINYDDKHTASVVDIYMPSLEDKPEKTFYYFRLQEHFSRLAGPLRCIDDQFFWGSAATPDQLKYNPGDTLRDATGCRFTVSELFMNKTINRIYGRFTEKNPNGHIFEGNIFCGIYNSEDEHVDNLPSFYYLDSLLPGAYYTSYTSKSYDIFHATGHNHIQHNFDLTREDATPPMLTLFRITDIDTHFSGVFDKGDTVKVQFSLADNNYYAIYKHKYQPVNNDSTKVYVKSKTSEDWLEISVDSIAEDSRSGIFYCGMITDTEYDSNYFDLRIRGVDSVGNSIEHTFTPAFMVRDIQQPLANDDSFIGEMNNDLIVSEIVSNDENPFGSNLDLQVIITSEPQHGVLQLRGLHSVIYSPDADYVGNDAFNYKVRNEKYTSDAARVDILLNETETGIEIPETEETDRIFNFYPNPAHDMLYARITTESDQPALLLLYDIHGKCRLHLYDGMLYAGTNNLELELNDLQTGIMLPGIYLVEIITQDRIVTQKLIIR